MMLRYIFVVLLVAINFSVANAWDSCDKPEPPWCIDGGREWHTEDCQAEVQEYRDDIEKYIECLQERIDELEEENEKLKDDVPLRFYD